MADELLGIGAVADVVGLRRGTVYVMKSRGELPDPDQFCVCGSESPLWYRSTIEEWNESRPRR